MASSQSAKTQTISSLPSLTPQRIQSLKTFLASDEPVTIIPSFSYKSPLNFLLTQEPIPPLQPGIETSVPLWLATYLRKRNLCRLKCPTWMNVPNLKNILAHERDPNQENFSRELPFRYAEVSRAIFQVIGASRSAVHAAGGSGGNGVGGEEVPQAEVVRLLLEDIAQVRMDKIRRNLHNMSATVMGNSLEAPMPVLDVTGIGSMEMAAVKPFLEGAFEDHLKLVRAGTANANNNATEGDTGGGGGAGQGKRTRNHPISTRKPRRANESTSTNGRNDMEDEGGKQSDDADDDDDLEEPHAAVAYGSNAEQSSEAVDDANNNVPAVSKSRIRRYRS